MSLLDCPPADKKLLVYYAHPINTYNSCIEKADLKLLKDLGFLVNNPNTEENQGWFTVYRRDHPTTYMDFFLAMVQASDALAFRAFPEGTIGAGVGLEINEAKRLGLPIIQLPPLHLNILTIEQTRERIGQSYG